MFFRGEAILKQPSFIDIVGGKETSCQHLLRQFTESGESRKIITQAAQLAERELDEHWQLGFEPVLRQNPDGQDTIHIPSTTELSQNSRYRHSLEVANIGVELATNLGLSEREKVLLGVGLLFHDLKHPVFSHLGERFLQEVTDFSQANQPELHGELKKLNLVGTHEERLLREADQDDSPLAIFLREYFTDEERRVVVQVWQEQGVLGGIAHFVDTAAYLNLDSVFFGYRPPHFERDFKDGLVIEKVRDGKARLAEVNQRPWTPTAIKQMLLYRDKLFGLQYAHPATQIIEQMQLVMLANYLAAIGGENRQLAFSHNLQRLFSLTDREVVKTMRVRALVLQSPLGLAFFGLLPEISSISQGQQEDALMVEDTYYEKRAMDERADGRLPPPLKRNFWIHLTPRPFWEQLRPILELLCRGERVGNRQINPATIKEFFATHYRDGHAIGEWTDDERSFAEYVSSQVLARDFSYDYPLPDILAQTTT
ncbi:MAG: HD domain-containing protein [Candidatus Colwellbacteria bacterium]|nr:HD domain-containing protein [Candidatus Colwellbacteria bacterium]